MTADAAPRAAIIPIATQTPSQVRAMPPALAKSHAALDQAVDRCYRKEPFHTDRERVEYLFALYEKFAAPLAVPAKKPRMAKS